MRVLIDCANGAATAEAPALFRACGVKATIRALRAGREEHQRTVWGTASGDRRLEWSRRRKGEFDLGVTFDGDADRALFSDAEGNVVNGDAVLLIAGCDMQARGALVGDTVVATTMSNMGLEMALKRSGFVCCAPT